MENRLSIERRISILERKHKVLRSFATRLYNDFYYAQIRRKHTYGEKLSGVEEKVKAIGKRLPMFIRLCRIAKEMESGKSVVMLDSRQAQLLKVLLKRQKPYKRRGQSVD